VARMMSARVALKEAGGKASKLDVKRADDAADKAEKKANGVAPAGGKGGKGGRRYTKSQIKNLVKAQVKKALMKHGKAKGKTKTCEEGKYQR